MNRKKLLDIGDKLLTALIVLFFIITILFKVRYIETGSMKPTLQVGSIVYVNPFSYSEKRKPNIGDIAMYRSSTGMEYIHRIVDVTEDGDYIFKGDNNSTKDFSPVPLTSIEGKVVIRVNIVAPVIRAIKNLHDI
ncbi:MAG: signal peptidase I [Oribacterium sp.]|nr:signal peptidase I [Oribacterium sp.]